MPHGFVNLLMQDWLPGSSWRGTWRKILRRRCFFVKSLHVQRSEKEPKWAVKSTLWLWWFWAQKLHNHLKSLQRVVSNCGMGRLGQRTDNDFNPSGEFLSGMRFASKSCIIVFWWCQRCVYTNQNSLCYIWPAPVTKPRPVGISAILFICGIVMS